MSLLFPDLYNPAPDPLWTPVARNSDPQTSHQAAEYAAVNAGTCRARALQALVAAGDRGLTDFELAAWTHLQQTSVGVRRKELVRMGLVESTGERRPSPSGALAMVWRVTAAGVTASQQRKVA